MNYRSGLLVGLLSAALATGCSHKYRDGVYERHENGDETTCKVANDKIVLLPASSSGQKHPIKTWVLCSYGSGELSASIDGKLALFTEHEIIYAVPDNMPADIGNLYRHLLNGSEILAPNSAKAKSADEMHTQAVSRLVHEENKKK